MEEERVREMRENGQATAEELNAAILRTIEAEIKATDGEFDPDE